MVRMAWQKLSLSAIWDLAAVSELNKQEVVAYMDNWSRICRVIQRKRRQHSQDDWLANANVVESWDFVYRTDIAVYQQTSWSVSIPIEG